jgi:FkbM family methyltransferase
MPNWNHEGRSGTGVSTFTNEAIVGSRESGERCRRIAQENSQRLTSTHRVTPGLRKNGSGMIARFARFANDCYHIAKAPAGSKANLLRYLVIPGGRKLGFRIVYFDRPSLRQLYREIFARQHYYFQANTESPTILDCGANLGMASLYFKWLYPRAHVKAFEADPTVFRLLNQNIAQNNLDIETYNCALWDGDGEVDFFVDPANPGSLLMSTDISRCHGRPIKVGARRLSDFISENVDFLKLDVEGAEHRVLSDLLETGKIRQVRQMVVEYHHRIGGQKSCFAGFLEMLEQSGFEYQIFAAVRPVTTRNVFQDVLVGAYR